MKMHIIQQEHKPTNAYVTEYECLKIKRRNRVRMPLNCILIFSF